MLNKYEESRLAIVGLGYVGLPLAVEFGKRLETIGFDIDASRVSELGKGLDRTGETSAEELQSAIRLTLTTDVHALKGCNVFIVTVPTPVDEANRPDLTPLEKASATIGSVLKRGDVVIYESTVYPGTTEEVCVPVLEKVSGLKFNQDFFCGYSPERINPGGKQQSQASGNSANTLFCRHCHPQRNSRHNAHRLHQRPAMRERLTESGNFP